MTERWLRWGRKAKEFFLFLLACVFLIVIVEGLSGVLLFFYDVRYQSRRLAESSHTRYDPDLGWVNIPNFYLPDAYGPGVYLKTDSNGFRNNENITPKVPPGKFRIICSGDSFTLGYGVDNDHTWCQSLASLDPRMQTVNMGQGGYGVDQAYLWYMRDGKILDHDAQILAVISDDVRRMHVSDFLGYGKPVLKLRGGQLAVTNVPVPKHSFYFHWLALNRELLEGIKTVQLMGHLGHKFLPWPKPAESSNLPALAADPVLAKVFESLQVTNRQKGSVFIVLFLATKDEALDPGMSQKLRDVLEEETKRQHIPYFDLTEDFSTVHARDLDKLFIAHGIKDYAHSAGHYTAEGNELVAKALFRRLTSLPEFAGKLSGRALPSPQTLRTETRRAQP